MFLAHSAKAVSETGHARFADAEKAALNDPKRCEDRTHLALAKGTPAGRSEEKNLEAGCRVVSMPRLGGLHHRYNLAA